MEYESDNDCDSSEEQPPKLIPQGILKKKLIKKQNALKVTKRGTRESKRFWKEDRKRFSSLVESRGVRTSWEKKEKLRTELKNIKQLSRSIIEERARQKQLKKERRLENLKRREANAKKAEIVQEIKNTAKLKKMKKKQLRNVEKRDVSTLKKR